MNKASYCDTPTKLATVQQARQRYKMCRNTLMRIAEDKNAVRRFGRLVRIDIEVLDKATENY